jgi:hypothetical protein
MINLFNFPSTIASNFFAMTAWCLPCINPGHMAFTNSKKFVWHFSRVSAS